MKTAHDVLTGTATIDADLICRRCGSITFERLQRTGFVQRRLLPFFNLYPWRCVICNKLHYRPARNNAEVRKMAQR